MSLIDEALSANATIAHDFDPGRGKPPAPKIAIVTCKEIMIINHTDCGMLRFADRELEDRLRKETGKAPIAPARFYSFTDAAENTREQIQKARSHPWISPEVPVRGSSTTSAPGGSAKCSPTGSTSPGKDGSADQPPSPVPFRRLPEGTSRRGGVPT